MNKTKQPLISSMAFNPTCWEIVMLKKGNLVDETDVGDTAKKNCVLGGAVGMWRCSKCSSD
jgi:hypothetical protein